MVFLHHGLSVTSLKLEGGTTVDVPRVADGFFLTQAGVAPEGGTFPLATDSTEITGAVLVLT